jgi:hypothetical protein
LAASVILIIVEFQSFFLEFLLAHWLFCVFNIIWRVDSNQLQITQSLYRFKDVYINKSGLAALATPPLQRGIELRLRASRASDSQKTIQDSVAPEQNVLPHKGKNKAARRPPCYS